MKPVLLATDGSPTAEKATATAIDLARLLGTELVIVSVWDIAYAGYSAMGFAPDPDERRPRQARRRGGQQGHRRSRGARGGGRRGNALGRPAWFPVEAICEAAEKFGPQFLVIGSHGWGAMKRALFGSVSTGVLHHATCPVLVVPCVREQTVAAENGVHALADA